ncbi:hypothetical protein WA158_001709 [Blastocystis sp. Blastoise]
MAKCRFLFDSVKPTLQKLYENNSFIYIITNQACIEDSRNTLLELKTKIEELYSLLGLNIPYFLIPYRDFFRKPSIGCWDFIRKNVLNQNIDVKHCYFIGDGAGRHYENGKVDYTDVDLLFSQNMKCIFYTPEAFFEHDASSVNTIFTNNNLPLFNPIQYKDEYILNMPCFTSILNTIPQYKYILLVGNPNSGKTWFIQHYMNDYTPIHNISELKKIKDPSVKLVIDNYNASVSERHEYIRQLRHFQQPILCLNFNKPKYMCRHLHLYRRTCLYPEYPKEGGEGGFIVTDIEDPHELEPNEVLKEGYEYSYYVSKKAMNQARYINRYTQPTLSEGFDAIQTVPLIPGPFTTDIDKDIFFSWLG